MTHKISIIALLSAMIVGCGGPDRAEPDVAETERAESEFAEPELVAPPETKPETNLTQAELINRGQGIAESACASCHAIGKDDVSLHAEAPAFRTIGQNYDVWTLDEAFAEGIMVGHPDMPVWELIPEDIEGLLTYMDSIQVE